MDYLYTVPSPCYLALEGEVKKNLAVLENVQARSGADILLALKGFAMFSLFPLIRTTLKGTAASGYNEARLGREEFGGQVHTFSPAYRDDEIDGILALSDHLVFNSFSQWRRHREKTMAAGVKAGIRINPENREVATEIYDPCQRFSRLGVTAAQFREDELDGITGLHFHNLCECNSDSLERTVKAVEEKFGHVLPRMEWVNFGGGHHITRADYDVETLVATVKTFSEKWDVKVFLEPGEAVALNAGVLVATVLDIVHNEMEVAVLDTSAAAHMPDVLEMPYRPEIIGAGKRDEKPHVYRLTGNTCLAGDIIGDYGFDAPLQPGDRLAFTDMLHYSMVKNTTFNGINLPSIGIWTDEGEYKAVRDFGYQDYRDRLS